MISLAAASCRAAHTAVGTATARSTGAAVLRQLRGQKMPSQGQAEQPGPWSPRAAVTPLRPWEVARPICGSRPLPVVGLALEGAFQNFGKAESDWSCSGGVSALSSATARLLGVQRFHQQNCSKKPLWGETAVAWLPNPAL